MKQYTVDYINKDGYLKWFHITTNNFWEDVKIEMDKKDDIDYIICIKMVE
jgi:hypothetical protein